MISSLNVAFRIKESRSWFKVRAIALGLTLVISILIFAALCIVLVGGILIDWIGQGTSARLGHGCGLEGAAMADGRAIRGLLVRADLFLRAKRAQEDAGIGSRRVRRSARFCGSPLRLGFRIYLRFFNIVHGNLWVLGALIILVVWLYVTGLAFLIGGEINANIERAAAENPND